MLLHRAEFPVEIAVVQAQRVQVQTGLLMEEGISGPVELLCIRGCKVCDIVFQAVDVMLNAEADNGGLKLFPVGKGLQLGQCAGHSGMGISHGLFRAQPGEAVVDQMFLPEGDPFGTGHADC